MLSLYTFYPIGIWDLGHLGHRSHLFLGGRALVTFLLSIFSLNSFLFLNLKTFKRRYNSILVTLVTLVASIYA